MITGKYPPEESNISMKFTPGGVTYTWPTGPRGSIGAEFMGSVLYLIVIAAFMGYGFVVLFTGGFGVRSIGKGINFGHLFIAFLLLVLLLTIFKQGRTLYLLIRPPLPAALELTSDEIIYRTGTKRLKLKIDGQGRIGPVSGALEGIKSKTYILPLKERDNFVLERVGDYLRLSFEYGDEAIEVGSRLKDTDKEWLYNSLKEFK